MRNSLLLILLLSDLGMAQSFAQGRPPVIVQQPTNQLMAVGSDAVFIVIAAPSVTPLRYQWSKDDVPIPDATESMLVLNKVHLQNTGNYSVSIVNAAGSITSKKATLTLLELLAASFSVGDTVILGGSLPKAANWYYQWYFNGSVIEGSTNSCLSLTNIQWIQKGNYAVSVSNELGTGLFSTRLEIDPVFTKVHKGAPENFLADNRGGVWGDINNDQRLDLFIPVRISGENLLFINNIDYTFSSVKTILTIPDTGSILNSRSGAWGDFDNDGLLDLFVANVMTPSLLYHNQGNGFFTIMSTNDLGAIAAINTDAAGCLWGDYNNDGFLDLFLTTGRYPPNQVWLNNAAKNFSMAMLDPTFTESIGSYGAAAGDYDNDGYQDLLVCNLSENSKPVLYHNKGNGTFSKVQNTSITQKNMITATAIWGDFDNNGCLDLFLPNWSGWGHQNSLFLNNGDGTFTERMEDPIVKEGGVSPSACWGDYDNDGFLDLFVANCGYTGSLLVGFSPYATNNYLYHNNGDGTFTKITTGGPVNVQGKFTCASFIDYNRDGFLDLFLTYSFSGNDLLYRNNGNTNGWIVVNCEGRLSNKSGIGAKVRINTFYNGKERWQMREITGGDGAYSSAPLYAHFGLGDATNISLMRIEWPSGIMQELNNVPVNQYLQVTEHGVGILPRRQELFTSAPLCFKVTTTLSPPIFYQWRHQGTNIINETNAVLYIANPQLEHVGDYSIWITNDALSLLSSSVLVTLPGPPVIDRQPEDLKVSSGSQAVFRVTVLPSVSPLLFQWKFNGIDLPGENKNLLVITNVQPDLAGSYTVSISNSGGVVNSVAAHLTIVKSLPPEISLGPSNQTVLLGTKVRMIVSANGTEPFTYQWFFNNQPLSSITNSVFEIENVSTQNQGYYHITIINEVGSITSKDCWLNVLTQVPSGVFVSTLAGSGDNGSADGPGISASFSYPNGGFVDSQGYIYVADALNCTIRRISPDGAVQTLAGNTIPGYLDGPDFQAQFNLPLGVYVTATGEILVADSGNSCIRMINSEPSRTVITISGSGQSGYLDGPSATAQFGFPNDLVLDALGNLFVTEFTNHVVRKITPEGNVSTFIGNGTSGNANGLGTEARLNQPGGIAIDKDGMLYITEWGGNQVRKITPNGTVNVFSGSGKRGFKDGPALLAQFNNPDGLVVDATGNVYITEYSNHSIRKINPDGSVMTLAGTGLPGYADGDGLKAQFTNPGGIGLGPDGCLYVMDTGNRRIRKLQFFNKPQVVQQPLATNIAMGATAAFSILAQGTQPIAYQWQYNGKDIPDATNVNLVIPCVTVTDAGAYSVRISNLVATIHSQVAVLRLFGLLTLAKLADGSFLLELMDSQPLAWRVETTKDFLEWSYIGSMMITNQNAVFIHRPPLDQPNGFFRALTP